MSSGSGNTRKLKSQMTPAEKKAEAQRQKRQKEAKNKGAAAATAEKEKRLYTGKLPEINAPISEEVRRESESLEAIALRNAKYAKEKSLMSRAELDGYNSFNKRLEQVVQDPKLREAVTDAVQDELINQDVNEAILNEKSGALDIADDIVNDENQFLDDENIADVDQEKELLSSETTKGLGGEKLGSRNENAQEIAVDLSKVNAFHIETANSGRAEAEPPKSPEGVSPGGAMTSPQQRQMSSAASVAAEEFMSSPEMQQAGKPAVTPRKRRQDTSGVLEVDFSKPSDRTPVFCAQKSAPNPAMEPDFETHYSGDEADEEETDTLDVDANDEQDNISEAQSVDLNGQDTVDISDDSDSETDDGMRAEETAQRRAEASSSSPEKKKRKVTILRSVATMVAKEAQLPIHKLKRTVRVKPDQFINMLRKAGGYPRSANKNTRQNQNKMIRTKWDQFNKGRNYVANEDLLHQFHKSRRFEKPDKTTPRKLRIKEFLLYLQRDYQSVRIKMDAAMRKCLYKQNGQWRVNLVQLEVEFRKHEACMLMSKGCGPYPLTGVEVA